MDEQQSEMYFSYDDGSGVTVSIRVIEIEAWPIIIKKIAKALEAAGFIDVQEHLMLTGSIVYSGKSISEIPEYGEYE